MNAPAPEQIVWQLYPPARPLVMTSTEQARCAGMLNELFCLVGKRWPGMN